jgi:P4 family phage/plasmid primase-like protien
VVDFRTKEFRDGTPQDYISKCTGIAYQAFDPDSCPDMKKKSQEILTFMEQLFPVKELNLYMWEHLASVLIGTNLNQTFNIYRGSGSNGKSKLTDLMSMTLGQYKGTVPITLVTEKRNAIGGTSSEVIQLKGVRYAVMQEPSKDARINEGMMKELTGGDPIQARALYCESETFMPQFKLVVCTNTLFEINSNDDGTWRRIRICDFMSKFVGPGEEHTDSTPYIYPKDRDLEGKMEGWAPVFGSMLVKLAFEKDGYVEDCDIVKASSNKYRHGQDHLAGFVEEKVFKTGDKTDFIKKSDLASEFKLWFQESQGLRKAPKGLELYEYMDKRFGKCTYKGWRGVKLKLVDEEDDPMIEG